MKKVMLLAMVTIAVSASCSKKNEPSPTVLIVGKWLYAKDTAIIYQNGIMQALEAPYYSSTDYIQFNQSGTGVETYHGDSVKFTYSIDNKTLTINNPTNTGQGFEIFPDTQVLTIRQLSNTNLSMYSEATYNVQNVIIKTTLASYLNKTN